LATVHLPVIAKLFPDAKIVFSYRDPRDVVFSCFRRRFAMSEQKYEMLSLDGIAACYAGVMALADLYSEKLDLDALEGILVRARTLVKPARLSRAKRKSRMIILENYCRRDEAVGPAVRRA